MSSVARTESRAVMARVDRLVALILASYEDDFELIGWTEDGACEAPLYAAHSISISTCGSRHATHDDPDEIVFAVGLAAMRRPSGHPLRAHLRIDSDTAVILEPGGIRTCSRPSGRFERSPGVQRAIGVLEACASNHGRMEVIAELGRRRIASASAS